MTHASAASSPDRGAHHDALPEVLRRVGRLEVRAARVVDGFLNGRHHSPFLGRSLEFREHREYAAGDDLRHVDWKVWGRQDRLYVKQYEEETNLRATLLVDSSASMAFRGDADAMNKHEYAATAACALAYLLTQQHDAVACRTFADGDIEEAPLRSDRAHVATIADLLARGPAPGSQQSTTDLGALLRSAADTAPRRSVVVLFSDLLCPVDGLREGLALLASKAIDTIVFQVLSDDELDFPLEGATRFVGLEGGAHLDANPRALRAEYLKAIGAHQDAVETVCASQGAEHVLIRTSDPLDSVLVQLLAGRGQAARRR